MIDHRHFDHTGLEEILPVLGPPFARLHFRLASVIDIEPWMSLDLRQRGHYIARIPRPTLSKPGWVQQGLETGQVTSGSGSGVILATCDKRVLPAVVTSESAPDVTMGPLMPGCRRSLLPFAHPPPAVASFTPPHKHQETFDSPRSCLQYLISHLSQAEYLQLREAKVYPNSDHHYDALLLRIRSSLTTPHGNAANHGNSKRAKIAKAGATLLGLQRSQDFSYKITRRALLGSLRSREDKDGPFMSHNAFPMEPSARRLDVGAEICTAGCQATAPTGKMSQSMMIS
ncbi:hypothetical protein LA080_006609 [Diaporthe eres]|nr:hypothetical protein LA080_006609 [Diaporthe eres]